jgi:pimeloyl-ACP methyl ester carboxylesterase
MKPKRKYLKYGALLVLLSVCLGLAAFIRKQQLKSGSDGTIYEFTIAKKGNMIDNATCYAWIPNDVGTIRSVIVHQHGCTREDDAHQMMYDIQWRELARKYHSILLAPKFITGSKCGNWCQPANGSDGVFLSMLDTLALKADHPEIKTIPWALWGHSGGAGWVTTMAGKFPQRVATMIVQACGSDISNVPAALKIPILHHNGIMDLCYQNAALFAAGRRKGAYWAHAVNPVVASAMDGHMVHDLRMLAIPWVDACLAMRLPLKAGDATLRDMDTTKAWLGDTAKRTVTPVALFKGDKYAACWFPNQALAEKWVEYMATGTVTDKTPPPAPHDLTATYSDNKVTLKWKASPDLESGLRTFIIYRDGKVLQTLAYTAKKESDKKTGYQAWNNGDNPVPIPAPEMTFTDTNVDGKATHNYQVSTVNWSDVASAKSKKITLMNGVVKM